MERAVSFEEPQVLLEIPGPFSESGQTRVGHSCAISSRRKRRRADVALGIDGEAFNLYSVKRPRLATSHPIPPQSTFTAGPVFAHTKGNSRTSPRRYSYAAVRGGAGQLQHQLLCYHEQIDPNAVDGSLSGGDVGNETRALGEDGDEVVFIDVVPAYRKVEDGCPPFELVSVCKSGKILCLSGDLKTERWSGSLSDHSQSVHKSVRYAAVHDAASLLEGFLAAHPEVVAQINPGASDSPDVFRETQLMVTVSSLASSTVGNAASSKHELQVSIVARPEAGAPTRSVLHHLGSWPVDAWSEAGALCKFHLDAKRGQFSAISAGRLSVFDLSQTVPAEICRFRSGDGDFAGTARIRNNLLVASAQQRCSVYDTKYGSLLARSETWRPSRSLKRKRGESGPPSGPLHILRFEAGSGTLFGLTRNHILAIKLNMQRHPSGPGAVIVGRLADSLGRAAAPRSLSGETDGERPGLEEARPIIKELDATLKDMERFDAHFNSRVVENTTLSNLATQQLANYALVKVFSWTDKETKKRTGTRARLRVARMPRETFHWLTFKGLVTPQNVEHALCQHAQGHASLPSVSAQELVEAMAQFDPSLVLLSAWLELQPHPELSAFVQALKHLLESFDADEQVGEGKLLREGKEREEGEEDMEIEAEESAAERDLEAASTLLEDGMQIRAGAIKTCLSRLSTSFHQTALSKSFRANMSQRDMVLLIDLLRVELSEDGWTSDLLEEQTDEGAAPATATASGESLAASCSLLNGVVDALGSGGLLAGLHGIGDEHDSAEGFLGAIRQETSTIIESIQEATFFSEFLKDFLRFRHALWSREGKRVQSKLAEEGVLPLGLKAVQPVSSTRIGAAGEIVRRSNRDIRHQLSQRVGAYTFESIRL